MRIAISLVLLTAMAFPVLFAQDEVVKNYSSADFEKFLKDDLKKDFDKAVANDGRTLIYTIREVAIPRVALSPNSKFLIFQSIGAVEPLAKNEDNLKALDAWNRDAIYSRAYMAQNKVWYEGTLSFAAGLSPNQVKAFYNSLDAEYATFKNHFDKFRKNAGVGDAPVRGKALAQGEQVVYFPLGADENSAQTGWRVRYIVDANHGLRIVGAWFKRPGESPAWIKIAEDLNVCQLYVPYEDNSHRYFDMDLRLLPRHAPWKLDQTPLGEKNMLGPHGKLLDDKFTVREDRDAGLLWVFSDGKFNMENQQPGALREGKTYAFRRQEMMLWGVYQGSNYFYVLQYSFHNDGMIVCRVGSTGKNLGLHTGAHMHNTVWRVQLDLGGSDAKDATLRLANNQASLLEHKEVAADKGRATTKVTPIDQESKYKWEADDFTTLRITNLQAKNRLGNPIVYDMAPLRYGNARHFAPERVGDPPNLKRDRVPSDDFTHYDFWITNNDSRYTDCRDLPNYVSGKKKLEGNPVIWHISSNLHVPRDEDYVNDAQTRATGCAGLMFSGFELRPRSLFRDTPFLTTGGGGTGPIHP